MVGDDAQADGSLMPYRNPSKTNYACVVPAMCDNQFTEVLVKRDEYPSFFEVDSKDLFIAWIV